MQEIRKNLLVFLVIQTSFQTLTNCAIAGASLTSSPGYIGESHFLLKHYSVMSGEKSSQQSTSVALTAETESLRGQLRRSCALAHPSRMWLVSA
jgi:hypothetical protein